MSQTYAPRNKPVIESLMAQVTGIKLPALQHCAPFTDQLVVDSGEEYQIADIARLIVRKPGARP